MARAERSVWACLLALLLLLTMTVLHNWGEENGAGAGVEAGLRHTRVRFLEIGVHQRESIAAWCQAHNKIINLWTVEASVTIDDVNV